MTWFYRTHVNNKRMLRLTDRQNKPLYIVISLKNTLKINVNNQETV